MRGWAVPFIWAWYGLARDVRGSMAPLIAFGVIVGISGAALSVDLVRGSALQQSLHMAADAAALAAAARLPDTSAATDVALAYVEKNMPAAQYGRVLDPADVEFGLWDPKTRAFTPQSGTATAVRVTTRLSEQNENAVGTFFAGILGRRSIDVAASAIAGRGGAPCVIALDPAAKGSTTLKTNAAIEATGCGVQVNSTTNAALNISGSSSIDASDVCVGGTVSRANSATTTPEPREHCPGQADPLANLQPPSYSGCDHGLMILKDVVKTLSPGVYCAGIQITGTSDITLAPGTYVLLNGPLMVASTAKLSGENVSIYLKGLLANIDFLDDAQIALTAPTTGDMAGILFFQDRQSHNIHFWAGDSSTNLHGVIYVPGSKLYSSNVNLITPTRACAVLIANALEFDKASGMSIDLTDAKCRAGLPGPYQRGVVLLD